MRTIAFFALASLGCSASLNGPDRGPLTVTRFRAEPYSFTYSSQMRQSERLVIRDATAWQAAWASIRPNGLPVSAAPNVDFTREMVVVAALGERPTGGYSIFVDSAATNTSGLTIWIGTDSPGPHCGTSQALTQPVDIARIPRTDTQVHFVDIARVTDCQ